MKSFILSDKVQFSHLFNTIQNHYLCQVETAFRKRQQYFDTFDWRFYHAGYFLVKEEKRYALISADTREEITAADWAGSGQAKFWQDFPPGSLRKKIRQVTSVRALLELAEIARTVRKIAILNRDEKTVLRINLEEIDLIRSQSGAKKLHLITVHPIRGYGEEFTEFSRFLTRNSCLPVSKTAGELIIQAAGKKPGDYSSKLKVALNPAEPAYIALAKILFHLLSVMRRNEKGIIADIDTEFLHDFRVAVRRTRSAITQIRGVLPEETVNRFKKEFSALGKWTNRLRDLDVYLLKEKQYRTMLPDDLRTGLESLFSIMRRQRKAEHNNFVRRLHSPDYDRIIFAWEDFLHRLEKGETGEMGNSAKPIYELARKFIFKQYKKVVRAGLSIYSDTPDEELHRLRIQCKKLRYLLEFFTTLFPEEEMAGLIRHFKKLQDNLGEFNDLSLQQQYLKDYLQQEDLRDKGAKVSCAAVGGLMAVLYNRQMQIRQNFGDIFNEFYSKENRVLFKKLFS